jgi:hypothetical protein
MLIVHSMDTVNMPNVPGCRTKSAKIRRIQAVDTFRAFRAHNAILLKMGGASQRFQI